MVAVQKWLFSSIQYCLWRQIFKLHFVHIITCNKLARAVEDAGDVILGIWDLDYDLNMIIYSWKTHVEIISPLH